MELQSLKRLDQYTAITKIKEQGKLFFLSFMGNYKPWGKIHLVPTFWKVDNAVHF